MAQLVFDLPTKTSPGYLKRMKEGLKFKELWKNAGNDPQPEIVDEMIPFLVQYVSEPEDREAAAELLWDASEEQIMQLLDAIVGKTQDDNPDPPARK